MAKKKQSSGDLMSELSDAFSDVLDALSEVTDEVSQTLGRRQDKDVRSAGAARPPHPYARPEARFSSTASSFVSGTKAAFSAVMRIFLWSCGGALAFFAVLLAIASADMLAAGGIAGGAVGIVFCVLSAIGAGGCLRAAKRSRNREMYLRYTEGAVSVPVRELATAMRKKESAVLAELGDIIRHGGFREGYLTPDGSMLFLDGEAYRAYLSKSKAEQEREKPEEKPMPEAQVQMEQTSLLSQLKSERRKIDDPIVCAEVEKLERSATEIFNWVRSHPEDAPQVRRFTSYYLPTTLKLLHTYNEMDLHAESSAVAEDIQHKIHASMISVNEAFANLRDTLLRDTALDVDAEISALNTVLTQEGLVPDEISKR